MCSVQTTGLGMVFGLGEIKEKAQSKHQKKDIGTHHDVVSIPTSKASLLVFVHLSSPL